MAYTFSSAQPSKDSIKKTFLELYRSKPLNQITVKEISDSCNLSRTTFYFYFEDINALYLECVEDAMTYMEVGLSDLVLFTVGRDFDRYVEAYTKHLSGLQENPDLYASLLSGSENTTFRDRWFQSIYKHCGQTLSFSRNVTPELRENLIHFFAAGQLSVLSTWVLSGCKAPVNSIALSSAQILFHGVYGSNISKI